MAVYTQARRRHHLTAVLQGTAVMQLQAASKACSTRKAVSSSCDKAQGALPSWAEVPDAPSAGAREMDCRRGSSCW